MSNEGVALKYELLKNMYLYMNTSSNGEHASSAR